MTLIHIIFIHSLLAYFVQAECQYGIIEHGNKNDKDVYVNKHNELRDLITNGELSDQPRGTNLKKMVYSQELEEKAQELANSCEYIHKAVNGTQWSFVGQNLYISKSTSLKPGAEWNRAIQSWFDEHKKYTFGNHVTGTGHYTQVVWADSDNVGCGYSLYRDDKWYNKLYVCNYGPGGNIVGALPYETA